MIIKLERIQQKFASICFYRFFPHVPYTYTVALEKLSLHYLRKQRPDLDAFFVVVQVYLGLKYCISLLENVSLRVPPGNLRDFSLFGVRPSNIHCPSARCACAANVVDKDLDIRVFAIGAVSLNPIYIHQPKIVNIFFVHNPNVLCYVILVTSRLRLFTFLH
jgi:hypothetical protein